jgi:acyl CoA:acetate/3-ketoacid CoA transferase alpha subunit
VTEILSLADAVAELVHDGDTVALEGFTHLTPFAAGHEVVRQGRTDLTLVLPRRDRERLAAAARGRRSHSRSATANLPRPPKPSSR